MDTLILVFCSIYGLAFCLGPFSDQVADILSKLFYFTICLKMVAILGTLLTRYMIVFHGVDEIDDLKVVRSVRAFNLIVCVLVFTFDLAFGQTGDIFFHILTDTLDR
jgi:hypothetical protein